MDCTGLASRIEPPAAVKRSAIDRVSMPAPPTGTGKP
jgi:hypothetical protein